MGYGENCKIPLRVTRQDKKLKDGQPNYNWSQISVGRILTNPIYIGTVINGKESMKDIFTSQRQKILKKNGMYRKDRNFALYRTSNLKRHSK